MPKAEKQVSAVYHHAFRWSKEHTPENLQILKRWCRTKGDKWVFQAEHTVSDEGKENPHYQGYIHTKAKARSRSLAVLSNATVNGIHISPASKAGVEALQEYCLKEETRVAGPWGDKPIYMGADLWPEEQMPAWQKVLLATVRDNPDNRTMIWVCDKVGNNGKTKFCKYLCFKENAVGLTYGHSNDILNLVSKMPGRSVYIWNLTRAKPANLSELDLYAAMESVKDGFFVNMKYETKQILMNPPHVIVLANHWPQHQQISADRWSFKEIVDSELYSHSGVPN